MDESIQPVCLLDVINETFHEEDINEGLDELQQDRDERVSFANHFDAINEAKRIKCHAETEAAQVKAKHANETDDGLRKSYRREDCRNYYCLCPLLRILLGSRVIDAQEKSHAEQTKACYEKDASNNGCSITAAE